MIIITRAKLKFLRTGRIITINDIDTSRYKIGRDYACGIVHNRTNCRVEILEIPSEQTIRIRLAGIDRPQLLARSSQYGYVDIDPWHPEDDMHSAMFDEPEPVPADQLPALNRRHQERVAAKAQIINLLDHLAVDATATENRRLRNARRAASSL